MLNYETKDRAKIRRIETKIKNLYTTLKRRIDSGDYPENLGQREKRAIGDEISSLGFDFTTERLNNDLESVFYRLDLQ